MFTGLIERIGRVKSHSSNHDSITIQVLEPKQLSKYQASITSSTQEEEGEAGVGEFFDQLKIGDSIAIDGVCLTVVKFDTRDSSFDLNLAPETLSRSNLGTLKVDGLVNLERALSSSTRFGGHFVQGHVDRTGKVVSKTKDQDSIRMTIEFEEDDQSGVARGEESEPKVVDHSKYLIPKGYITIDGISLTITSIEKVSKTKNTTTRVSIMLIPHTQLNVTLSLKSIGDSVNLEFDMLVKTIVNVVEFSLVDQLERIVANALNSKLAALNLIPSSAAAENSRHHELPLELD
ncbi:hypothetical protein Pst134EA_022744 [Puccinia striiformis f. sp. tritici]|uniref:Riboflavin synthase, alpha subunit n=2 Tax=Puccinia striiformis TaxID=27350 RepID=A0A0L0UX34_9BASI|nr:hypothetical protein Pst134EA_022744 [Puccinia striiformis f. sp. tritici]KAH9455270.1 hypothetical protein Pst134EA_022744 [Puccinia striiformis f. sp. tritici]KAI9612229.1 hypothetical protein KEM48_004244 [Puccinia striiformis f. sp. tritici PST-130]KNE91607.1 riboflavin synthase, alpha subunit [Puccinia striiformis f. sp. tritici PST-78]POW20642.1 hypothetical protein PSHT_03368 [Puccinia striiformis]